MICPSALVASVTAAAIALAQGRSADQIGLLGAVFTQLGDTLTTIGLQQGIIEAKCQQQKQDQSAQNGQANGKK